MKKYFELGHIAKAQGIKGEVKIEGYTDNIDRFLDLKFVYFEKDGDYEKEKIQTVRTDNRFAYIKFDSVPDRNAAELLRGKAIFIDRENAAKLPSGSYYISDLIGMKVMCGQKELGILKDIMQTGSADIYIVKCKEKGTMMFPSAPGVILERNVEAGYLVVDEVRLSEVCIHDI